MTLPLHRTKIVATIGPASSSRAILEQMLRVGMSGENLERGFKRWLREGVRLVADEQRAVRTCLAPVVTDRLRVESARNTSLPAVVTLREAPAQQGRPSAVALHISLGPLRGRSARARCREASPEPYRCTAATSRRF